MKKETAQSKSRTPQESVRSKRKASPDKETPRKRRRVSENESQNHSEEDLSLGDGPAVKAHEKLLSSSERTGQERRNNLLNVRATSVENVGKRSRKRKAESYGEEPNSRRRRSLDLPETKFNLIIQAQRAEFEATYQQLDQLGDGGCGCVYAGYRKADHLPVAIKHIQKDNILCKHVEGRRNELSAEVAIMLKLASKTRGSVEESAPVSLLDWYDLDQELILVLERPVPCKDLSHYIKANGGSLKEEEAKIILRQLVDAAKDLVDKSVFHRDIKIENILIETGSSVPRVRLIDFGLGCFFKKRSFFRVFYGTVDHAPPEWMIRSTYSAGPTTVWQMGVVLFELLHRKTRFKTEMFLKKRLTISNELSKKCQDFLKMCLDRNPEQRPSLQQLRLHPWLK